MKPGDSSDQRVGGRVDDASKPVDFFESLQKLAQRHTGIGFVYAALDQLSAQYHLSDAIITVVSESYGSQMFRLGGRAVSTDVAAKVGTAAGIVCVPDVVPNIVRQAVLIACQRALSLRLSRSDVSPETAVVSSSATATIVMDEAFQTEASPSSRRRVGPPGKFRRTAVRKWISLVLLCVDAFVFVLSVTHIDGPVRFLLGLLLGAFIPGWSVVGFLKLENAVLEISLSIAVSFAILIVIGQVMMTVHSWHPVAFEDVLSLVCLPALALQYVQLRRREVTAA